MIKQTNLVDLSKVTLENPSSWNECIKYEIPRQWKVRNIEPKRKTKSEQERKQHLKEYQHNYYLKVTKNKRKLKRSK